MSYVVKYNGVIIQGPFFSLGEAERRRDTKSKQSHLPKSDFQIEHL